MPERTIQRLAILATVMTASIAHADGESAAHKAFFAQPIRQAAHRGGANLWPENTTVAYRNAAAAWPGILLEGDAQCTADGHVVLLHDNRVDRTTDGAGRVSDLTLAQVKALDAGYRFTRDRGATFPYRSQGVTIPTFLEALASVPQSRFLIEIKNQAGVPEAIVKDIVAANAFDRVILASFNPMLAAQVRNINPNVLTCYDVLEGVNMIVHLRSRHWADYRPQADMLAIADDLIDAFHIQPGEIQAIRAKGIPVLVHTINAPEEMRTYLAEGVDSVLTDYPDRLADVLAH